MYTSQAILVDIETNVSSVTEFLLFSRSYPWDEEESSQ